MATAKAANATQKCASTRRLARNTAQPFSPCALGAEFVRREHSYARPHPLMARAAILVARHQVLAGIAEGGREGRDEPRDEHRVGVGSLDVETVDHVRAGAAESDGDPGGDQQALRMERVLLRDESHNDLAVGGDAGAESGLDKLTRNVERGRVDG